MTTYRFNPSPVVKWPVDVSVPVDGGAERQSFTATFRLLPRSERSAVPVEDFEGTQAFLRRVWVGAGDLEDAGGAPLTWDDSLREAMLDLDFVVVALIQAYARAINGVDRKN